MMTNVNKNIVEKKVQANFISPGLAQGRIYIFNEGMSVTNKNQFSDVATEIYRFKERVLHIAEELARLFEDISSEIDTKDAQIIETHRMILLDQGFQEKVTNLIEEECLSVEIAVQKVLHSISEHFAGSKNNYLKQRADDFDDLVKYFQKKSLEKNELPIHKLKDLTIIVVSDLYPSTILACRKSKIKGVIAEHGVPTSHAAILARSLGIPVMVDSSIVINLLTNDLFVIIDSFKNQIILDPSTETQSIYHKIMHKKKVNFRSHNELVSSKPVKTLNSPEIKLYLNVDRLDELETIHVEDIDGIGLFRTEFLFMDEQVKFPSLKRQISWYEQTLKLLKGKPVVFRILDIGGDKFLPYFSMGNQQNPYLGLRAHRVFNFHPEILERQIEALLRTRLNGTTKILYPMVNTIEDIEFFKDTLLKFRKKFKTLPEIGIMVETPASVFLIRDLLPEIDFISIGTNDLVQYTLTVDRNNENVKQYYKPTTPVMVKMLDQVITAAREYEKPVTICGEIASDVRWIPLLIGLGIRKLSVSPSSFYMIKQHISTLDVKKCQNLAKKILRARYEREVDALLNSFVFNKQSAQLV